MESERPISQIAARPVRRIDWNEITARIECELPSDHVYYGIPRGGTIVAGIAAARGHTVTDDPGSATAYLDDIIDSGATKAKWSDKPFYALYERGDSWLVFPWEQDMQTDAEDVVRRQIELIGEDPKREGLLDTPRRVVRSWTELFAGYAQDPAAILSRDFDRDGYDEMIVCRDIQFFSTCEHHMQPFFGRVHIGYVPKEKVVGLSKLARLVEVFARRLQIQERLTEQIAAAIQEHVRPVGVGVVIEAQHFCMICRGVQKQESALITSSLKGCFRDVAPARAEFLALVHRAGR
jgi:GTP cyclohydrolase I